MTEHYEEGISLVSLNIMKRVGKCGSIGPELLQSSSERKMKLKMWGWGLILQPLFSIDIGTSSVSRSGVPKVNKTRVLLTF